MDILNPEGGDVVSGIVTVEWAECTDSLEHSVTYSLAFSDDGGSTWYDLALYITSTSYGWNTTVLDDGTSYMLRVIVNCEDGLSSEYLTGVFTVQNESTMTTTTTTTATGTTDTVPMDGGLIVIIVMIVAAMSAIIVIIILLQKGLIRRPGG